MGARILIADDAQESGHDEWCFLACPHASPPLRCYCGARLDPDYEVLVEGTCGAPACLRMAGLDARGLIP